LPTTAARKPAEPTRHARSRTATPETSHQDLSELAQAVRELATALKPLEALAEHVPALVEMANVWNAGKTGGRAAWRMGEVTGAMAKWLAGIGGVLVLVWAVFHAKWELILKGLAL
jgi:CHASE2 domain-containing sensor protein